MTNRSKRNEPPKIRCAIYTRKSTDEGLEQEFNSLDAQRESGEAYIASMKHEGWVCLPTHYDDGGFTGGNMDRPALQRLMKDIEAGDVDCVVVYKVDRLSRSLLDFARMMETFEDSPSSQRLAELQERIQCEEQRLTEIREESLRLRTGLIREEDVVAALKEFDSLWQSLSTREQARVLHLLIERVDYDGEDGTVSVTFRPTGIRKLAQEEAA